MKLLTVVLTPEHEYRITQQLGEKMADEWNLFG